MAGRFGFPYRRGLAAPRKQRDSVINATTFHFTGRRKCGCRETKCRSLPFWNFPKCTAAIPAHILDRAAFLCGSRS